MKILLIGELCNDITIYGQCKRLSPEAPIPVFNPTQTTTNLGMAGNVLENLKSLEPEFKVDTIFNKNPIKKTRYVDEQSGYILLRVDENDEISIDDTFYNLEPLAQKKDKYDAIVISDYNKGFITNNQIKTISELCDSKKIPLFLDTKKILGKWSQKVDFVKINNKEFNDNLNSWNRSGYDYFYEKNNEICKHLIITLGEKGASLFQEKFEHCLPEIEVRDTSGCGDSFLAGLVIEYLKTKDIQKSIIYANKVARIAASKSGIVKVKKEEVI